MIQISTGKSKAVDTLNEVNQKLTQLSRRKKLSIREALDWTDRIGNFAQRAALALDLENRPEETLALYKRVADVLARTAKKVPEEYQDLIESISKTWTLSARSKGTSLARPTTLKPIILSSLSQGIKRSIPIYSKSPTVLPENWQGKTQTSTYSVIVMTPAKVVNSSRLKAKGITNFSQAAFTGITRDSLR